MYYTDRYSAVMNNKTNLLDCALKLFSSRGYDAVGVRDIVAASGVSKPTLYHYFGNKQGLLETLLNEYFCPFFCQLKQAAKYEGDLPLSIYHVISTCFKFAKQHPGFYRMQLSMIYAPEESAAAKAMYQINQKLHLIIEELFIAAAKDHGNMKCRHQAYAATLLGTINTYIGLAFIHDTIQLNEELVYKTSHQFMHGIYS